MRVWILSAIAISLFWCAVLPELALAQVNPETGLSEGIDAIPEGQEVSWGLATLRELKELADAEKWGPFVSVLIMAVLIIFCTILKYIKDLRQKLKPYMGEIAIASGVLFHIALALASLPAGASMGEWWGAIGPGIKTGFAAMGAYDFFVKRLLKFYLPKIWKVIQRWRGKDTKQVEPPA